MTLVDNKITKVVGFFVLVFIIIKLLLYFLFVEPIIEDPFAGFSNFMFLYIVAPSLAVGLTMSYAMTQYFKIVNRSTAEVLGVSFIVIGSGCLAFFMAMYLMFTLLNLFA